MGGNFHRNRWQPSAGIRIKGQTVLDHKCILNVGENNIELNECNLSNGIYIVNIYTEGVLKYKPFKIIVVHNL